MRKAVDMTKELIDLLAQYSLTERELSVPLPTSSSSSSSKDNNTNSNKDTYLPPGCEDICGDMCKKMRRDTSSLDEPIPSTSSQSSNSHTGPASNSSSGLSQQVSFTGLGSHKLL